MRGIFLRSTVTLGALIIVSVALLALSAGSASAALLNSGFEMPDASGGDVAGTNGWTEFNFVFTSSVIGPGSAPVSRADNAGTLGAGTQSLKTFGPFQGPPFNTSGVFQADNSVLAGQAYELEAWVMNWVGDPFQNVAAIVLQFWDAPGGEVGGGTKLGTDIVQFAASEAEGAPPGVVDLSVVQDGAEVTDWTRMAVSGIAPAGTMSAQVILAHIQTGCVDNEPCRAGSIYWDDVTLKVVPVPAAAWLFASALGLLGWMKRRQLR